MTKLQQIKRNDGTLIHSVNIPTRIMNDLPWDKGEELSIYLDGSETIMIKKV